MNPGKKPIMHEFPLSEDSDRSSSEILRRVPQACLGMESRENLVVVSVTLTLSTQEPEGEFVVRAGGGKVDIWGL